MSNKNQAKTIKNKFKASLKLDELGKNLKEYKKIITNLYEDNTIMKDAIKVLEKEKGQVETREKVLKQEIKKRNEELNELKKEKILYFFENRIYEAMEKTS